MITLLSLLAGFFSSFIKPAFAYFQDKQDKAHELSMMQLQLKFNQANLDERLEEVRLTQQSQDLLTRYIPSSHSEIAGLINEITKTFLAITIMTVYCLVAYDYHNVLTQMGDASYYADHMWTTEDYALLGAIIGYYFGTVVNGKKSK